MEDSYSIQIEGKEFRILDTAGEEDYQNMLDPWISSAKGFILVYAINDTESLEDLKKKIKRIEKNDAINLPILIVGNKCDLENQRTVNEQNGMNLAKSIGAKFYETSALNDVNKNVRKVFDECGKMILSRAGGNVDGKGKCLGCEIF